MLTLTFSFFLIAWLYASVGFGGGSSYLALLSLSQIPFTQIPSLSLICNILVTCTGFSNFYREGHFSRQYFWPLILGSIPMVSVGAMIPISKTVFSTLLGSSLLVTSFWLLISKKHKVLKYSNPSQLNLVGIGAFIGFISGIVGIGGGIFLSPIMLSLTSLKPKQVAALASAFIFINSIAGLLGQLTKLSDFNLLNYWPLFLAVFFGGQIGARLSSQQSISQDTVRKLTALLTFYAGFRFVFWS